MKQIGSELAAYTVAFRGLDENTSQGSGYSEPADAEQRLFAGGSSGATSSSGRVSPLEFRLSLFTCFIVVSVLSVRFKWNVLHLDTFRRALIVVGTFTLPPPVIAVWVFVAWHVESRLVAFLAGHPADWPHVAVCAFVAVSCLHSIKSTQSLR